MKRTAIVSALCGASVCLVATAVHGADVDRRSTPYMAPAPAGSYVWAGPYVGLNLGYQWGGVTNLPHSPMGAAGGIQAGYNWQNRRFVVGAETDLQISGADDSFGAVKFSNHWFGTLRGRGGVALNSILLYATGGLAYGGGELQVAGLTESHTHWGWALGAGMEVAFTPQWSARAEYLYIDLADKTYALTGSSNGIESSLLRFGANYRF